MNRMKQLVLFVLCIVSWGIAAAGPVDVNSADAKTISDELTGVGLSRANAIVEYRRQHGPFKTVDDLLKVKGIGERTLELNEDNIRLTATPAKRAK